MPKRVFTFLIFLQKTSYHCQAAACDLSAWDASAQPGREPTSLQRCLLQKLHEQPSASI